MRIVRLVMISDTHEWSCEVPDGDILIHAGDLTMAGTVNSVDRAGVWLRSLPHKHKIVIAGNHDWLFEKNKNLAKWLLQSDIIYLENEGVEVEGIKLWGSPITPWFFDWAFNVNRGSDIKKYWDMIPEGLDVLITHGPPQDILDQANPKMNTEHCGCEDLLMAVKKKKPKIHVFGHIHGGYGFQNRGDTVFYNASIVDEAYQPVNDPWCVDIQVED